MDRDEKGVSRREVVCGVASLVAATASAAPALAAPAKETTAESGPSSATPANPVTAYPKPPFRGSHSPGPDYKAR